MNAFFYGMSTMGFLLAGVFFLRFWKKSGDALFIAFSAAFLLFSMDQIFLYADENSPFPERSFIFRLAGFALLIFAVLRKNLK
jgi:hypothetical protein